MEVRFTVGEMAKLSGVSKQMLIFYDRSGVFSPRYVGAENGYRYYSADQLEQLDSILILRELGFSLQEIRAHMAGRSGENTLSRLREQRQSLQERIRKLSLIEKRVDRKIQSLEDFFSQDKREPGFVQLPPECLAVEPVAEPRGLLEVDLALKRLLRRASAEGYSHAYRLGDTVGQAELERGDFLRFQYAFLPLEKPWPKSGVLKKPGGLYARRYHVGAYANMGESYKKLLSQIQAAGLRPAGPAYEYCVMDCLTSPRAEEYITELQIPVSAG